MEEIWKDIKGWEGLYKISNLEWCTVQYNLTYGTARERRTKNMKERKSLWKRLFRK